MQKKHGISANLELYLLWLVIIFTRQSLDKNNNCIVGMQVRRGLARNLYWPVSKYLSNIFIENFVALNIFFLCFPIFSWLVSFSQASSTRMATPHTRTERTGEKNKEEKKPKNVKIHNVNNMKIQDLVGKYSAFVVNQFKSNLQMCK